MPLSVWIAVPLGVLGLILLVALTFTALLIAFSPGKTRPIPTPPNASPLPRALSEIAYATIGGVRQAMILKSCDTQNPVLLYLHGGPGMPEYPLNANRPIGLEREFTVCWWDQRGAGLSFDPNMPPDALTLDRLVSDTLEVADYLLARFSQERIYLCGHSFGTYLGMHTVARHPDRFAAYIGVGQVSNQFLSERAAYDAMLATARKIGDLALIRRLERFNLKTPADVTPNYLSVRTGGLNKQGIGLYHRMRSQARDVALPFVCLPEYTLRQKLNCIRGSVLSLRALWPTLIADNLFHSVPRVEVPVYIIQGLYDYQVSYALAKSYYLALDAPSKRFYTFRESAHCPQFEEPDRFMRILRREVLKR